MQLSNLPVVLGGDPVRPEGTFRRTPEVGDPELRYIAEQVSSRDWEPDATVGGVPVAEGLTLPTNVRDSLGVEQAALAAEFAAMQAPGQRLQVVPCDNGTHAIRLALAALSVHALRLNLRQPRAGDEVIVPALTWQATAGAALRRNLAPVLVDVLPGTLCIDPAAVEAAITDRTVAVVPVHLYNRMADLSAIRALVEPLGIAMIEDCAHAQGASYRGRAAGAIGLMGTFSGQGSKSLSAQELGLITTLESRLADQLCSLVTCGRKVGTSKPLQGDNDRVAGVVAALGRAQVLRFAEQNSLRLATFARLDEMVERLPGMTALDQQPEVDTPPTYKWAFRVDLGAWRGLTLDQLRHALGAELGCEFARIYAPLTHSPVYMPQTDPALRISDEYWSRIDPSRYTAPMAREAYQTVLAAEHAVGLDPSFTEKFGAAVDKVHRFAERIAREFDPGE